MSFDSSLKRETQRPARRALVEGGGKERVEGCSVHKKPSASRWKPLDAAAPELFKAGRHRRYGGGLRFGDGLGRDYCADASPADSQTPPLGKLISTQAAQPSHPDATASRTATQQPMNHVELTREADPSSMSLAHQQQRQFKHDSDGRRPVCSERPRQTLKCASKGLRVADENSSAQADRAHTMYQMNDTIPTQKYPWIVATPDGNSS